MLLDFCCLQRGNKDPITRLERFQYPVVPLVFSQVERHDSLIERMTEPWGGGELLFVASVYPHAISSRVIREQAGMNGCGGDDGSRKSHWISNQGCRQTGPSKAVTTARRLGVLARVLSRLSELLLCPRRGIGRAFHDLRLPQGSWAFKTIGSTMGLTWDIASPFFHYRRTDSRSNLYSKALLFCRQFSARDRGCSSAIPPISRDW